MAVRFYADDIRAGTSFLALLGTVIASTLIVRFVPYIKGGYKENMPNNEQGSQGNRAQEQDAESQGMRGGYGNTSRNAGGSQQGGQDRSDQQQGQHGNGGSEQGNKHSSGMKAVDDEA